MPVFAFPGQFSDVRLAVRLVTLPWRIKRGSGITRLSYSRVITSTASTVGPRSRAATAGGNLYVQPGVFRPPTASDFMQTSSATVDNAPAGRASRRVWPDFREFSVPVYSTGMELWVSSAPYHPPSEPALVRWRPAGLVGTA